MLEIEEAVQSLGRLKTIDEIAVAKQAESKEAMRAFARSFLVHG